MPSITNEGWNERLKDEYVYVGVTVLLMVH